MLRTQAVACSVVLVTASVILPTLASAQETPNQQDTPAVSFRWRNRPSIQIGEHVRLDIRLKLSHDWREFDPKIDEDHQDWRVRRTGINGQIGDDIQFEVEHDLNADGRWRDVFVNWSTFRQFELRGGRFKVPFGRETLTSVTDIDFAFRALASSVITPARDRGVMAHGRFLRRGFTYEVGVFDDDGDNGELVAEQFPVRGEIAGIGPSFAGRVTATPLRPLARTFSNLRVGAAYGQADVPEGLNSFIGSTVYGTTEFFAPVYVKGRRTRVGVEFTYTPGPVGVTAEWMQAREQRHNQGLGDDDLSDVVTTGWYAAGTWLLTGEDKNDFNNPRRSLFNGGFGAIEVAARLEKLGFESAEKLGTPFRNPRAEHILPNSDTVWTIGVNWFLNRWVRVTVNGIHEELEDPERTTIPGVTGYWSGLGRLQLVF
jgi:phosphate-selective porin OprO/OprP